MDSNRYEELLEHMIGLDDTFRFHCTACGQCCKNRDDILINPYDLYRIASHLNVEMWDVLQDYCVWYVEPTSKLPIVIVYIDGVCPFLEVNKPMESGSSLEENSLLEENSSLEENSLLDDGRRRCRIHAAKPTVCALYPLGRAATEDGIRYLVQDVNCGTTEEEHTVREWLAGYGLEDSEAWFVEWQKVLVPLSGRMREIAEKVGEETLYMVAYGLLDALYVSYDKEKPFMEQFQENAARIDAQLETIEGTIL